MIERDLFGLSSERKIQASKVREYFTPHQPKMTIQEFLGRDKEITSLIQYLNTPGQHALLYGNRGVGKSSLAHVSCEILLKRLSTGNRVIIKRCDSTDNFVSIVSKLLLERGIDVTLKDISSSSSTGMNKIIASSKTNILQREGYNELAKSPSWVAEQVMSIDAIFLIDEVDAIREAQDKNKIAELIKQLSDGGSKLKILIVGIAETASELTAGHPSVSRCLREVPLSNMKTSDLKEIMKKGAEKIKCKFEVRVLNQIAHISNGYPHFTHLLALKAAENAIIEERKLIDINDLKVALQNAMSDAEGTLRENYNKAIRSTSDEFKKILLSIALCPDAEFTQQQIKENYQNLYENPLNQNKLSSCLQRFVSENDSSIIKRISKGIYKFNDPRMSSFIRIAQNYLN